MRLRFAALFVLAAVLAGCGHHAASIPRLANVPPSALGRSFLADLSGKPRWRYVQALYREALVARAEPVDVRVAGGGAAVTLAVSDPAPFLKHRLQRFLNRTRLAHRENVYLRIVDAHGGRVLEWSVKDTEGTLWIRHDVFECSPIKAMGVPVGAQYPRCPA